MKRLIAAWTLCLTMLAGSFGVLLLQDRSLGVPLPYSVPIAFASMLALSPLLLVLAKYMRLPERQPRSRAAASSVFTRAAPLVKPRGAEGVVLLDFSGIDAKGRAA